MTTAKAKLKFEVDRELFPFESRFCSSPTTGAVIHYIDEGEGPTTVLMLHGNPTWSFLYRNMIPTLTAQGFRCVALDYPGFGLSTAPNGYDFLPSTHAAVVQEFVHKLDLKDMILVVQDWAGPIGLWVAEQDPDRFIGFVIGNTWAWPLKNIRRYEIFSWIMGGPIGRFMSWAFNGVWQYFMREGFLQGPSRRELDMYYAPFAKRQDRRQTSIFPRQLVQAYDFEKQVQDGIGRIDSREVLLLWGTHDFAFREEARDQFMKLFPKHTYYPLEASHFWQDEKGEVAARYIAEWVQLKFTNK